MGKLKELLEAGWVISGVYNDDEYYLLATPTVCNMADFEESKNDIKSAAHVDLEMAVIDLYEKCKEIGLNDE